MFVVIGNIRLTIVDDLEVSLQKLYCFHTDNIDKELRNSCPYESPFIHSQDQPYIKLPPTLRIPNLPNFTPLTPTIIFHPLHPSPSSLIPTKLSRIKHMTTLKRHRERRRLCISQHQRMR